MSLQGVVGEFAFDAIVRLLAWSRSTGVLQIDAETTEGSIWVREGSCLWAETGLKRSALEPQDAVVDAAFELSLLDSGTFRFDVLEPSELTPPKLAPLPLEKLLSVLDDHHDEWTSTGSEMTALDDVIEMVRDDPRDDVVIRPPEWRLLAQIGAGTTVRELLGGGEGLWRTGRVLASLMSAGLVRCSGTSRPGIIDQDVYAEPVFDEPPQRSRSRPVSDLLDEIAALADITLDQPEPVEEESEPQPVVVAMHPEFDVEADEEDGSEEAQESDPALEERRLAIEMLRSLNCDDETDAGDEEPARPPRVRTAKAASAKAPRGGRVLRMLSGDR